MKLQLQTASATKKYEETTCSLVFPLYLSCRVVVVISSGSYVIIYSPPSVIFVLVIDGIGGSYSV